MGNAREQLTQAASQGGAVGAALAPGVDYLVACEYSPASDQVSMEYSPALGQGLGLGQWLLSRGYALQEGTAGRRFLHCELLSQVWSLAGACFLCAQGVLSLLPATGIWSCGGASATGCCCRRREVARYRI